MRVRFGLAILIMGGCVRSAPGQGLVLLRELRGESARDVFGAMLAATGDLDGDGVPDFVIGTRDNLPPHRNFVRAYSGRSGTVLFEHSEGATWEGFGFAVSDGGALSADGSREVLVGAPLAAGGGRVDAFNGRDGALRRSYSRGLALDEFGGAIAAVGDVDGDGLDDFVVGSSHADVNGDSTGSVRVLRGVDGAELHAWHGSSAGDSLGGAVAGIGDVDHDGHADVLASAVNASTDGTRSGAVFLFSGATGAVLGRWTGESRGDKFGRALTSLGDLDSDGVSEFAVGAPGNDANGTDSGAVYVFSISASEPRVVIRGARPTAQLGFSIGALGDVDRDGVPDWTAGANLDDVGGSPDDDSGSAHVYSGVDGHEIASLSGSRGERVGTAVAGVGDVDGDGTPDWLVSGSSTAAADTRGVVRLYSLAGCAPCGGAANSACRGRLSSAGIPSVTGDPVVLRAEGLPARTVAMCLQIGAPSVTPGRGAFAGGAWDVGDRVVRVWIDAAATDPRSCGAPLERPLSKRSQVRPGDVWRCELRFRDVARTCGAAPLRCTNSVTLVWGV